MVDPNALYAALRDKQRDEEKEMGQRLGINPAEPAATDAVIQRAVGNSRAVEKHRNQEKNAG